MRKDLGARFNKSSKAPRGRCGGSLRSSSCRLAYQLPIPRDRAISRTLSSNPDCSALFCTPNEVSYGYWARVITRHLRSHVQLKKAERTGNIDKYLSRDAEDALKHWVFKNEPYVGDDPDDFDEWLDDNLEDIIKGKIRD